MLSNNQSEFNELFRKRESDQKEHGKDQVKKLPISVQNEGLMYNPINMHIEDPDRLYDRDLREKNKRKRFEVRYDVEKMTRKEGFSEQERADMMKLNKVSHSRFKVEQQRGFDILTNDPLQGPQASKTAYNPRVTQPRGVWTRAMQTTNSEFLNEEERNRIMLEQEEKMKKTQTQNDFYQSQTEQLRKMQTYDPLAQTNIERRSQRVFRGSQSGFEANGAAQRAPAGPEKQTVSMRKTIDNPRGGSVARMGSISQATP